MHAPRSFAFALAGFALLAAGASAQVSFPVLVGHGTAVIDGVESPDEWTHGNRALFDLATPLGGTTPATVQFMDDGVNAYWKIEVGPSEVDWLVFALNLDGDDDDLCETGDDLLFVNTNWGMLDYFQDSGCTAQEVDTEFGGTSDGSCDSSAGEQGFLIELAHPLDSADDAHDVSLEAHDSCGLKIDFALCFYTDCTANQPRPSPAYSSARFVTGGIFLDGFETGDPDEWSVVVPGTD